MLSVNTHRPLFWFLGGPSVASMADLRGRRLAVHAPHTAPGCFARIVLRRHGLDPDRDLECVVRAPGDYQMDLRRLRDNSIDAVDPAHRQIDDPAVQAVVRANRRALKTIADRPDVAVDYMASFLNRLTRDEVQRHYERYIGPYFTSDGRVDLDIARRAVDAVAAELGIAPTSADEVYKPAQ